MVTLQLVDTLRKMMKEELEAALKPIQADVTDTRKKVNQIYDAMERQGYQFSTT